MFIQKVAKAIFLFSSMIQVNITINIIINFVSCSSTETPAPTLDSQVKKFDAAVTTKTPTTSAADAAKTVEDATSAADKKTAVEKFATIPTLDTGFTYEVKSATVDTTTKSQVNVTITITETAATTNKTKDAVLKVSGLALSTLTIEAAKFDSLSATAKTTSTLATDAAATIKTEETAEQRLTALKALLPDNFELPTLADGFSFVVTSAAVNETTKTQVDVTITVSQTGNTTTQTATLKISGFTEASAGSRN